MTHPKTTMDAALALDVDHVSFTVDNLEHAMKFYAETLGCVEIDRPPVDFPGAWLRIGNSHVALHLIVAGDQGPAPLGYEFTPSGFENHVALRVKNHDETFERLRELGYAVVEGDAGIRQMFVRDPSGNCIELVQRG